MIGGNIKGSHHNEPFVVENAAHANRLFASQKANAHSFEEHFEDAPVSVMAPDETLPPRENKGKKAKSKARK